MPENGYLKEVALDDHALPDQILDFTQGVGGSKVKMIVNRNGGRISGHVLDESGKPASGFIRVFLGTDPKHMDGENAAWSSDGKFSFKALRPGKYHVVAVDVSEMMQSYSSDGDRDGMLQRLFDAGTGGRSERGGGRFQGHCGCDQTAGEEGAVNADASLGDTGRRGRDRGANRA